MRSVRKYLITLVAGFALAAWVAWSQGILDQTLPVRIYHILCDAFFVAGVLITCVGLLIFTTNEGTFDMIVYGMQSFFSMFKKDMKRKHETYYDYRVSRSEKKLPFGFLLICGVFFLAISAVMYLLYARCL